MGVGVQERQRIWQPARKQNREVTGESEGIRKKSNWRYLLLSRFPGKYPHLEIYFLSTPTPTYIPKWTACFSLLSPFFLLSLLTSACHSVPPVMPPFPVHFISCPRHNIEGGCLCIFPLTGFSSHSKQVRMQVAQLHTGDSGRSQAATKHRQTHTPTHTQMLFLTGSSGIPSNTLPPNFAVIPLLFKK